MKQTTGMTKITRMNGDDTDDRNDENDWNVPSHHVRVQMYACTSFVLTKTTV